jgi:hypothetical protein
MSASRLEVRYWEIFILLSAVNLTFATPVFTSFLIIGRLDPFAILFLVLFWSIMAIPIGSWLVWLISKGSNWMNTKAAVSAGGAIFGQYYAVLLGGFLGFDWLNQLGAIVCMIIFFIIGMLLGIKMSVYYLQLFKH